MRSHSNEFILVVIISALVIAIGIDRLLVQTTLTQVLGGLFTGLVIGGGIVYVIRAAAHSIQSH